MAMKSFALDQYLKTATGGNVFAEHALDVNRWRLVCTRCGQRKYYIADDYTNKGRLDSSVQQFAKEHAHLKPKVDVYAGTVTFESVQIMNPVAAQSEGLNASISIPDVKPAPLPAPKEGRKFR